MLKGRETIDLALQTLNSEGQSWSFESPHIWLNLMSLFSDTLLTSTSLPLYLLPPPSTSHYNIPAICLKIHEPAYVLAATFISIRCLLQTTPSSSYLPFAGNMPLLIFPHEADIRASEPAPLPHIKNYFNSIDHKAYVWNKFQLELRFQIVKMKSIGKGARQGLWNRGWVWDRVITE